MCEWNPTANRARYTDEDDCPNPATWSVGGGRNNIHLCDSCATLPKFKRLTARERLKVKSEQ